MKRYRYYFFLLNKKYASYVSDNNILYAYTDSKKYYKRFMQTRNMNVFKVKERMLTKEEVGYLAIDKHSSYLLNYNFLLDNKETLSIPITYIEKSVIESIGINNNINIIINANIIPAIFNEKYIKLLYRIGYTKCYIYNQDADDKLKIPKSSMIKIFIKQFSHLLNFGGL